MQESNKRIKSALFVDFDNIYLGLKQLDEVAAERFAVDPNHWLNWLAQGMRSTDDSGENTSQPQRDILIRQCYLNPRDFGRYRPYFIRSAFSVIDCPSLTSQGKNSADIYMVMEIIDTLEHKTHFDEFIILSGDADFTPVLLRLRAHGRKTAILAAGPASPAFIAASDMVISEDIFIEHALTKAGQVRRSGKRGGAPIVSTADPQLMDTMAEKLYAEASANGEILATDLPRVYRDFPEFRRDSNWLGFFSLRALTTDITRRRPDLRITEGDPWRVTVHVAQREQRPSGPKTQRRTDDRKVEERLRRRIIVHVKKIVAKADEPILMAKAAHEVTTALGPQVLETQWAGAGTFKNLLEKADNLGIEIATSPSPGYLYDPKRHDLPTEISEESPDVPPNLPEFTQRVSQITGTPNLTPKLYSVLFTAITDDLKRNPYNLTSTSKSVRDLCIERGESVSRSNVSFVLKGITYAKHRFSKRDTPLALANVYRNSVLTRCKDAELELSQDELKLIDIWLMSGLNNKA